jgi:hypothetical protein
VLGAGLQTVQGNGLALGTGPVLGGPLLGKGVLAGLATAQGPVDGAIKGAGVLAGLATAQAPVLGTIAGGGGLVAGLANATGFSLAAIAGAGKLTGVAFGSGPADATLLGAGSFASFAAGFGPALGTIQALAAGAVAGLAIGFGYTLAQISFSGTPITPVTQPPGGTGSSRSRFKRKKASELFAEELAKLELEAEVAKSEGEQIAAELQTLEPPEAVVPESVRHFIALHERAVRKLAAKRQLEEAPLPAIPVYFRTPAKSVGVERVEAIERLTNLARIARHREEVARENIRKIKERIDIEAATYLMKFLMWDD